MSDRWFSFWYKWLLSASIFSTVLGFIIAILPDSVLFSYHTKALAEVFFDGSLPNEAANMRSFLFGPLGGTIAGYFLLQTFVVWIPFRQRATWAWHAIFWALMTWFVIDTGVSLLHGAYFNIWMINISTLIIIGLPLMMTRKVFDESL